MKAFIVLTGKSVGAAFVSNESAYIKRYLDYNIPTSARSIFKAGNKLITIGDKLSVYLPSEIELKLLKEYPDISGNCCSKTGNVLAVANTKGLFLYDVTDPENIQPIP
jgi:hypothetical protein